MTLQRGRCRGQLRPAPGRAGGSRLAAIAVLIPAFNPDRQLPALVRELRASGFARVVLVDDGSGPESSPVFDEARVAAGCTVVRHAVNRGKGRAIKTGFSEILRQFPGVAGVVTVDADGQHRIPDVVAVAASFLDRPDALVIGCRRFARGTPLRSRFGNEVTRRVFAWAAGSRLEDTQSGLRCFPASALPRLLDLRGERYEYEMNVLASCAALSLPVRAVPIATVYIDGNRSSHFRPFLDSMKIYFLLLRFGMSSLLAAFVDFLVFTAVWWSTGSILGGIVVARGASASLNFVVNRGPIFRSSTRGARAPLQYAALVVALGALSYAGIRLLVSLGVPVVPAKVVAETILFLVSFRVQRDAIFFR